MLTTRVSICAGLFFLMVSLSFALTWNIVGAQFNTGNVAGGELVVRSSPTHPGPGELATIELAAFSVGSNVSTIHWYVDGVERTEAKDARSISVVVGDIGESTTVRAVVVRTGDGSSSVSKTLTPSEVNLIIEADTTVPAFYQGRPLPSAGALIDVVAIPFTGKNSAPSTLSYKWQLDGNVLFGGSIKGKQRASFVISEFGDPVVSVSITDTSGEEVARKALRVSRTEPEIYFYRENPLRSTNRIAINDTLSLTENEMTVRAEPYFVNKNVFDPTWSHSWRLNGERVKTGNPNPQLITFRQSGGAGSANIDFEIQNTSKLLQSADESFTVAFDGKTENNN